MATPLKYVKKSINLLILFLCVVLSTSCNNGEKAVINVSAAASLTQVITEIVDEYKLDNKDVRINLNFAGTNTLKMQIEEGADVDLFLSANFKYYDELDKNGFIDVGSEFAKNKLCIIKHKDNKAIHKIEDLTKPGLKVIVGNEEVPIGKYTLEVLGNLNAVYGNNFSESVLSNVASMESHVKRIVTKINLNEGDCGFVYKTDVTGDVKENVDLIEIDDQYNVISRYYAGIIKKDTISDGTKKLYQYILSEKGQEIFKKYGFEI